MAYTPINWQTGDTITAEKLNKCDNGWSVETASTTLCEESVTTADDGYGVYSGTLVYSTAITASRLTITFNGTEYICTGRYDSEYASWAYGAPWSNDLNNYDFSTYPFNVYSESGYGTMLATESAGTYTIKITDSSQSIEVSDDFQSAVNSFVDTSMMPMLCVSGTTTHDEMASAMMGGSILLFQPYGSQNANISIITSVGDDSVTFFPTDSNIQTSFVAGVFVVTLT